MYRNQLWKRHTAASSLPSPSNNRRDEFKKLFVLSFMTSKTTEMIGQVPMRVFLLMVQRPY
ncbi:hypothetical protein E2C01_044277 [Portunus trituberculatus]|uniref:Uncharacterized protein n=1 Tax=Portunus trituberculatus TaxID=210409 RepID=A0A5B7FYW4_PORTR|nr:hypothetical protein [Portunus trituberculatus]